MNTIIAIQTSRKDSVGVPNKNISIINGKTLFKYNLDQAIKVDQIDKVFVVSDIDEALDYNPSDKLQPIPLTKIISNGNHYQAIKYGVEQAEKHLKTPADVIVILLGNSIGAQTNDLNNALNIMKDDPSLDSICSVSQLNAYNPARAYKLTAEGNLNTLVPQSAIPALMQSKFANERNVVGDAFFFNGSFWICRRKTLFENTGLLPFPWLGHKIHPFIQDYYLEIDEPFDLHILDALARQQKLQ